MSYEWPDYYADRDDYIDATCEYSRPEYYEDEEEEEDG